jgi:hypothetical protein
MAKHTITNSAAGPRGVALADGTTLYIEPGQTVEDVEVADGHVLYEGLEKGDAAAKRAAKAREDAEEGDKPA